MIKGAIPYSIANQASMQAEKYIRDGDFKNTKKTIQAALKELAKAKSNFKDTEEKLKNEPMVYPLSEVKSKYYQILPKIKVLNPEFSKLEKQLEDLWISRETIYNQNNMPEWFKNYVKKKSITAVSTLETITIDGNLTEAAWDTAQPVEYFIDCRMFKLCPQPLFAEILYDKNNLYIAGEVTQPLTQKIKEAKHGPEKYAPSESIEILLVPDKQYPENMCQLILDSSGNLFSHKKIKTLLTEPAKRMPGWDSGAVIAVKRKNDKWRFEISIPYKKLGTKPGKKWKCMLAYNRIVSILPKKIDSYASSFVDGKGFHKPEFYSRMIFSDKAPIAKPDINIKCNELNIKNMLHASGTGSLITFKPELETRRPLINVSVEAVVLNKKHKQVGKIKLKNIDYLPLLWKNQSSFQYQLEEIHKAVILKINVTYQTLEGKKGTYSKKVIIGKAQDILSKNEIFVPGSTKNAKALAAPAYFDIATKDSRSLFDIQKGYISFKFSSLINFKSKVRRCLFHLGPLRRNNPENYNISSICAIINNGFLSFMITNEKYKMRRVCAKLPKLSKGQWLNLSFLWNLNVNGKTQMEILVDGKILSGAISRWGKVDGSQAMEMKDEGNTTMQVGSLNSGSLPAEGLFENFLISPENKTKLFFSFNDTLTGKYNSGDIKGELKAHVGALCQ